MQPPLELKLEVWGQDSLPEPGLYALERLAVDSQADQRTVVEVLSAFVRERTRPPAPNPYRDTGAAHDAGD
ncbi:hypothetical protein [Frankia sp. AgW1.1]|uniref:hypothetical protein n=1 Tax=Frankia sp. AgW1.1 TaxID=1836971 RepID=UPI001931C6BA|nr:hypothetical protein [Frankia sp. AgW1.1]MBL7491891.1 hypothetical protein [Frankia sp. AgW1.1]